MKSESYRIKKLASPLFDLQIANYAFRLTYNADRVSGFVSGVGRGAIDSDTVLGGAFRGVWTRTGSIVQIRQVVQISDGSQNLDVIDIDILKDTFIIKAYTLK